MGNTAEILPRNPVVEGRAVGKAARPLPPDIKVSLRRGRATLLCRMVKTGYMCSLVVFSKQEM
jgi:hypothetical protein